MRKAPLPLANSRRTVVEGGFFSVDGIPLRELAHRNPANLAQTVQEVVAERPGTVRRIASEAEIAEWIEAAKSMPKVVEH